MVSKCGCKDGSRSFFRLSFGVFARVFLCSVLGVGRELLFDCWCCE